MDEPEVLDETSQDVTASNGTSLNGVEAEWTPSGARCITSKADVRFKLPGVLVPACITSKQLIPTSNCGQNFNNGAVLIDELHN